ncbi:MAG: ABC transporter ATP-binding protein [Victivallaceae bacterium]|nr:ABC transporter ATP-binding protein [Victivallaceae bacterium]
MSDNAIKYIVETEKVFRSYPVGKSRVEVLRGVSWQVARGEWSCLFGASGCGKTTLLNLLGGLEKPDSGVVRVAGVNLASLGRRAAAKFRSERVGFVFQSYCLLPELNILDNAALPARLAGKSAGEAVERAAALLKMMGLDRRLRHRPAELSGGEQQRAAIARALVNDPDLLLADEPTGNLDSRTGREVLELFARLRAERGQSIVMITHNRDIAKLADRSSELVDGEISPQNISEL